MAKGWRKGDYNRQIFGQKINEYRLALEWSLGYLAQLTDLNKGTLQHVEKGESRIPDAKRQIVVDVLAEALEKIGRPINHRKFLELAGLTAVSTALSTSSPASDPLSIDIPQASSQEQLFQDKPPEEYARVLQQQLEWQQAAAFWHLAAQEAKYHGDWTRWSRCLLNAGLMALTCGQFEIAESRFKEVIERPEDEVSTLAIAEANIRLGWVYYEQDKFSHARQALLKSRTLLQIAASKNPRSLYLPEHGCTLVYCEGNDLLIALESTRLHWLGRTYVDWGMQQDNQALIKEGLVKLQKSGDYEDKLGLYPNLGFAFLRQIPALLYQGELKTTNNHLARSEELLGTQGTAPGHIYLHKGLFVLEEHPAKAKDFLEVAREGFIKPLFYSKGLSQVLKEISGIHLMENKKTGDQLALQYALATAILHPYGQNLEILQLAAHKMYWRMGEKMTTFNTFWQALEEKLWSMDDEPFSNLKYFIKSFPENSMHRIETGLEAAKKAIYVELFRR